jgi:hypothetical protein
VFSSSALKLPHFIPLSALKYISITLSVELGYEGKIPTSNIESELHK